MRRLLWEAAARLHALVPRMASGAQDKAVSCLWPWRAAITGPTAAEDTAIGGVLGQRL